MHSGLPTDRRLSQGIRGAGAAGLLTTVFPGSLRKPAGPHLPSQPESGEGAARAWISAASEKGTGVEGPGPTHAPRGDVARFPAGCSRKRRTPEAQNAPGRPPRAGSLCRRSEAHGRGRRGAGRSRWGRRVQLAAGQGPEARPLRRGQGPRDSGGGGATRRLSLKPPWTRSVLCPDHELPIQKKSDHDCCTRILPIDAALPSETWPWPRSARQSTPTFRLPWRCRRLKRGSEAKPCFC